MGMKIKNLTYILFVILLLIVLLNIFFNCKTRENYENLGSVNEIGSQIVIDQGADTTGTVAVKRDNQNNLQAISPYQQNNYLFTNMELESENSITTPTNNYRLFNLLIDNFDFCWDKNTHFWKDTFIIQLIENGGYVYDEDKGILFLTHIYCREILDRLSIRYSGNRQFIDFCLKVCKMICKQICYKGLFMSQSNLIGDDFKFFVLTKNIPNINEEIMIDTTRYPCVDNTYAGHGENAYKKNFLNKSTMLGNTIANTFETRSELKKYPTPSMSDIMIGKNVTSGIPFLFGINQLINNEFRFKTFNNVAYCSEDECLKVITITDEEIVSERRSPFVDPGYINAVSYTDSTSYFVNSLNKMFINLYNSTTYSNNNTPEEFNEGIKLSLNMYTGQLVALEFNRGAANLGLGNKIGITTETSNFAITTKGGNKDVIDIAFEYNGERWDKIALGIPTTDVHSFEYYYKPQENEVDNPLCKRNISSFTIPLVVNNINDDKYLLGTGYSTISSNVVSSIKIYNPGNEEKDYGVYAITKDNSHHCLYRLGDFDLSYNDLVYNPSWACYSYNKTGRLGGKDSVFSSIGINGGNNQFVTNEDCSIRFYFTMFGSFVVEANIKRQYSSENSIEKIANVFDKNFKKIFNFNRNKISAKDIVNNLNYDSNPATSFFGVYALFSMSSYNLRFEEDNKNNKNNLKLEDAIRDGEEDHKYLLYNSITGKNNYLKLNQEWTKYRVEPTIENCNYWFKNNDVYKKNQLGNSIDNIPGFGKILQKETCEKHTEKHKINIESNSTTPINTIENALEKCSKNSNCYGVSEKITDNEGNGNKFEYWGKDGIENNFSTGSILNTGARYDIYRKNCLFMNEDKFVNSGFNTIYNNNYGLPYSKTELKIQWADRGQQPSEINVENAKTTNNLGENVVLNRDIIEKFVEVNQSLLLKNLQDDPTNIDRIYSWYYYYKTDRGINEQIKYYIDSGNQNQAKEIIIEEILNNKDQIRIKIASQTLRSDFNEKLLDEVTRLLQINLNRQNISLNQSSNITSIAANNSSQQILNTNNMNTTNTITERFTNVDEINNKINMASNKIIKNCIYNIKDEPEKNIKNELFSNNNEIHIFILVICIIAFIVVFLNTTKKYK